MCFLVVRVSQIGGEVKSWSSSESLSATRLFFPEAFVFLFSVDFMCFNSAFEAFSVCTHVNKVVEGVRFRKGKIPARD